MRQLILVLIVLGLVWWLIGFLPLPEPFPMLIRVVIIVAIIWELFAAVGVTTSFIRHKE